MTGRSFILGIAITAVVCTIGGYGLAPAPRPMSAKVRAQVIRHDIITVIDSAKVHQLEAEKAKLARENSALIARAERSDSVAGNLRWTTDSLAGDVAHAETAADSARAWKAAYDARTIEADTLRAAGAVKSLATLNAERRVAIADSIAQVERTGRVRADSVIAQLLPLAEVAGDRCRIARFFSCPSRTMVAVGGILLGGASVAIATGKIRIPIRF